MAEELRRCTRRLHAEAERSGIIADILHARITLPRYGLFLRNLLPAYCSLEEALSSGLDRPGVRRVADPSLYRSEALRADLEELFGRKWPRQIVLLPAAESYAKAVKRAAAGDGSRLIAHAYTRYLGDLNGGQVLRKLLSQLLGLGPTALSFYDFPMISQPKVFAGEYRDAINRAGAEITNPEAVIDEAIVAFELNIRLSTAVQQADAPPVPQ